MGRPRAGAAFDNGPTHPQPLPSREGRRERWRFAFIQREKARSAFDKLATNRLWGTAMTDSDKRLAALAAVAEIRPGMIVGLGTGSTAAFAIEALGEQVRVGLQIKAVATSLATEASAHAAGIPLIAMPARIDLTIDGADEIDDALSAVKGAGGAMLREKVVAAASDRMIVIADGSKRVAAIGAAKIPVEVLPFAHAFVADRLATLGGAPTLRAGFTSDQGNPILDCYFPAGIDHAALAAAIDAIPGALGHGLFLVEVDAAYIATDGVVTRLERGGASD